MDRCDAGLFTLQQVDLILVRLVRGPRLRRVPTRDWGEGEVERVVFPENLYIKVLFGVCFFGMFRMVFDVAYGLQAAFFFG